MSMYMKPTDSQRKQEETAGAQNLDAFMTRLTIKI
jgi:hypothetical protein